MISTWDHCIGAFPLGNKVLPKAKTRLKKKQNNERRKKKNKKKKRKKSLFAAPV